jgi:hypothetical protein
MRRVDQAEARKTAPRPSLTAERIAGRGVVEQGGVHIETIVATGGQVLGFRELSLDHIEPSLSREAWAATRVQRGYDYLRPFDNSLPLSLASITHRGFLPGTDSEICHEDHTS